MLTIDDLNADELEEFWRRTERHARLARSHAAWLRRLHTQLEDAGVDPAARSDALTKVGVLLKNRLGKRPTPDDIRAFRRETDP